jgi:hypothetical protein
MNLRRLVGRVSLHFFYIIYHGEKKLLSENDDDFCFVLDQQALHKLELLILLGH